VSWAQSATIEKVWTFGRRRDEIDIVQLGKAYITAHHPIHTVDGWMMASQAAAKGQGQVLSGRVYPKLYSLQLVTGGNIIIDTSTSPDLPSTHIEAATMGYHPTSSTETSPPTLCRRSALETAWRPSQAQPSYSQVLQLILQELLSWPIPQLTPSGPETNAPPEFIAAIEKNVRGHRGEPKASARTLSVTTHLDPKTVQRSSEEHGGDLDAASMGTYRLRPTEHLHVWGNYA